MKNLRVLSIIFLLFISLQVLSQSAGDSTYRIRTKDGNEFSGTVVQKDSNAITIDTKNFGRMVIKTDNIRDMEALDKARFVNGSYWPEGSQNVRYFASPNGYGLRKGEGYYQNMLVFFNQVVYGVNDRISIGAGVLPLFMFNAPTPVWFTGKLSLPVVKDKLNFSANAIYGLVLSANDEDRGSFGYLSGAATYGSSDRNASFGLGWAFADRQFSQRPSFNFSFMHRTSKSWYLISENYLIGGTNEYLGLFSFGARWNPRNLALDFGLVAPTFFDEFVVLPWLGISVPFGRSKKDGSSATSKRAFLPASPLALLVR